MGFQQGYIEERTDTWVSDQKGKPVRKMSQCERLNSPEVAQGDKGLEKGCQQRK